jgi:hypothetical protein
MVVDIKGGRTLIDDSDLPLLDGYSWFVNDNGYAVAFKYIRGSSKTGQKQNRVRLHRFVMGAEEGQIVDHINQNKLDNRRSNLRFATKSTNAANSKTQSNNTSGFRGVSFQKNVNKWFAYINYQGKRIPLGYFNSSSEAAKVRNRKANKLFGEFAKC